MTTCGEGGGEPAAAGGYSGGCGDCGSGVVVAVAAVVAGPLWLCDGEAVC